MLSRVTEGADMVEWVEATDLETLKRKKKIVVTVSDKEIVVLYADGQVYALNNICVHKQRRLSRGLVFQGKIICPGHQWAFDLDTGWVDEWQQCQPTHKVKVEDGVVFIDPSSRVFVPACESKK